MRRLFGSIGGVMIAAALAGGALATDANHIPGGVWKVVGIGAKAVTGPTLEVNGDKVSGSGGCNRYSGPAVIKGENARFGPLASTRMACEHLDIEQAFFNALEGVRTYSADDERLILLAADGQPLVYLAR